MIRKWFTVTKKPIVGYDVRCLYCKKISRAWDYRSNALLVGYVHVIQNHVKQLPFHASWVVEE